MVMKYSRKICRELNFSEIAKNVDFLDLAHSQALVTCSLRMTLVTVLVGLFLSTYLPCSLLLFHIVFLTWCELVLACSVKNLFHTVVSLVDAPLEMNLRMCVYAWQHKSIFPS